MNFGKENIDISSFDYHLPADTNLTTATLASAEKASPFIAHIGAPKWGYKNWSGVIYPHYTKDKDFLQYYARHFNAIELNATFYQTPPPERMAAWKELIRDGADFKFCPKFPQSISHIRRFKNVEQQTDEFYMSIAVLREYLGPVFLQLADNATPKTFPDLKAYLVTLPTDVQLFVEVRNKNWFDELHRNDLFSFLKESKLGAVITDTLSRRDCLHMELPTPHAFIRFVACDDDRIDYLRLEEWAKRLKIWKEKGLQSLYFFIHAGDAPSLSLYQFFITTLNKELGLNIYIPGNTLD
ncbi:DUF72 domain-containing protein [Mucilaginibacter rubeus]|uniref:DUF72 domain-containing protein n=1 Tax=Mucilaginibacter rubeus TaxID=2027860 RepID=A0AAE6JE46_9SPHI|nr:MULTISPECIES: DUF72 domain-containing protein [Mucilaginibacter]QEM03706.1 DUF72 domain-containing protein [Mucilaginibacter rubeus]QEM16317.1 DUF72 domain-containing protein [Mucilaginibacter gossypii]QTE40920.1 DUF72 domain-containing protein [Mucilaginibacter rubeus]QTE47523.1 DUF72 domain-containing protein [Mucilaginibacter rubeus]QTE58915.1 DUF72 domain-containing protein [Mucilaginibacter rubeus]